VRDWRREAPSWIVADLRARRPSARTRGLERRASRAQAPAVEHRPTVNAAACSTSEASRCPKGGADDRRRKGACGGREGFGRPSSTTGVMRFLDKYRLAVPQSDRWGRSDREQANRGGGASVSEGDRDLPGPRRAPCNDAREDDS
jgi:hypothetical protein